MNVPSSTPSETADEPITSCSSWNQTTSYISAAQPLPTNSSSNAGRNRRGVIREPFWPCLNRGKTDVITAIYAEKGLGAYPQSRRMCQRSGPDVRQIGAEG